MNKVDLFVKESLLLHPIIFKSRGDVFCHLFCCNGNGFEWVDGVPRSISDEPDPEAMDYSSIDELLEAMLSAE